MSGSETHEDGVEGDEEVGGADGEEGPVEGEAPDGGEGVEVLRCAEEGADGPVEGREGRGGVGEGDGGGALGHLSGFGRGEGTMKGGGWGRGALVSELRARYVLWMSCARYGVEPAAARGGRSTSRLIQEKRSRGSD